MISDAWFFFWSLPFFPSLRAKGVAISLTTEIASLRSQRQKWEHCEPKVGVSKRSEDHILEPQSGGIKERRSLSYKTIPPPLIKRKGDKG